MLTKISPPLKYPGGKNYLAARLVALMPPHTHYVEPFGGGLAVLWAKDPHGVSEVVNDRDSKLINLWRVLRDEEDFERFRRQIEAMPFAREEWEDAANSPDPRTDPVGAAVAIFVRIRQSLAGRRDSFAPLSRTRTRRNMNEQCSAWLTAVEGLPEVHNRLRRVVIENMDAVDLIRREDAPGTLFYCDPPYVHSTRSDKNMYPGFEMLDEQHRGLLSALRECQGRVMLSGYPSDLYANILHGWKVHTFDLPNNAAAGSVKRRMTETVWCNF